MIKTLRKLLIFTIFSTSFVGCVKTYDINFTTENRLGGEWEVNSKANITETYKPSLFRTININLDTDITFTQKDLRKSLDEKPVAEFIIKELSYQKDDEEVNLSHLIGKKIIGRNLGSAKYEFTCDEKVLEYHEYHLISETGALTENDVNYLMQFNRRSVKIGDKWNVNPQVAIDSFKRFGITAKAENLAMNCQLLDVQKNKEKELQYVIGYQGTSSDMYLENDYSTGATNFEVDEAEITASDKPDSKYFESKGKYKWKTLFKYKENGKSAYLERAIDHSISVKTLK